MFIGIFMIPIYTRIFTPGEYGIIDLVTTFLNFSMIFLYIGYNPSLFRFYVPAESPEEKSEVASTSLFFEVPYAALIGCLLFLSSAFIGRLLTQSNEWTLAIQITSVSIPLLSIIGLFMEILRCNFQKLHFSILSIGLVFFTASLCIYLVVIRNMGIVGVFYGGLIAQMLLTVIGFWLTRRYFQPSFSLKWLKKFLLFNIPMIPAPLCYWVIKFADRYFLLNFRSIDEVGIYSVGVKLSSIIAFIVIAFNTAWGPISMAVWKEKDAEETYSKTLLYYSIGMSLIVCFLTSFAKEFLIIFTSPSFVAGYRVVGILSFGLMVHGAFFIFCIGINITKKTYHVTWTTAIAAIVNVAINFLLVPRVGMFGSSIAALFGYSILTYLTYRISQRLYPVDYKISRIIYKVLLPTVAVMGACSFIATHNIVLTIVIKAFLFLLLPLIIFLNGAVDKDDMEKALKKIREKAVQRV